MSQAIAIPRVRTRSRFGEISLLIVIVCLLAYLLGDARMALFDRDEGWYAEVARNMAVGGDWIVPHFGGQVFTDKPVFAFWCQAISMRLLGVNEFAARLPAVISGMLTLIMVWWAARKFAGPQRAMWTTAILGSGALFMALSKMALVDAELLTAVTAAQICLAICYAGRSNLGVCCILWIACGFAVMTKGPVVFGILGGTMIALAIMDVGRNWKLPAVWWQSTRWWWSTQPWLALILLPLVVGPWFYLVYKYDRAFIPTMLGHIFGPIFSKPLNSRAVIPGFYLLVIWPCFMPWSLLLPPAIIEGFRNRQLRPIRFCLAATLGPLIVIELVKQKLPHYLLPLAPPISFLIADVVVRIIRGQLDDLRTSLGKFATAFWAACIAIGALAPWALLLLPQFQIQIPRAAATMFSVFGITVALGIAWFIFRQRYREAFGWTFAGSLLIGMIAFVGLIPLLQPLEWARQSAALMYDNGYKPGQSVATTGIEPSIVFYLRGGGISVDEGYFTHVEPRDWPQWLVISQPHYLSIKDALGGRYAPLGAFRSLNTGATKGNGTVLIFRKQ